MNYTLKDLLDIPKLRGLLDSLDEFHSMPSAIIDLEGTVLTATAWQDICTNFHRVNHDTSQKCAESDRRIESGLNATSPQVVCQCPMGLIDAATPIVIEGHHLGTVFTGQFFIVPPDESYFVTQARHYGFDEHEYIEALRKVPLFSEEKLHKFLNFIGNLTHMLAEQGLQHKRQCEAEELLREREVTLLELKDTLQEQYEELQMNEESLREQNDELLATEEMLRVQIDEYVTSQKYLKESEERFKALHDASFGGIIIHDKGLILDCNQGLSDLTGFTVDELIGMDGLTLIAPEWLDLVIRNIQNGYDQRYEVEGLRKDGSLYPLAIKGKNIQYKGRTVRVIEFRDITEFKLAGAALRDEQLFSKAILDSLPGIFYLYTYPELRLIRWNKQHESQLGYEPGEIEGRHITDFHVPEAKEAVLGAVELVMQKGQSSIEAALLTKNRRLVPFILTGVKLEARGQSYLIGIGIDITERKMVEDALAYSLSLTNAALESTPDGILIVDNAGKITRWNQKFIDLWRVPAELLDSSINDPVLAYATSQMVNPDAFHAKVMELYAHPEESSTDMLELADGRVFERFSQPQRIGNEIIGRFWSFRDITERKEHEKERQKIEKLESLGVLAGGIAHDFNNVLTGIMGNISLAQMFLDGSHKSSKPLTEAERATVRATELAHQLLTFARGGEPVKKLISLRHLVDETVSLVLLGSNVKGVVDIPESIHAIEADEGQISQVFHNIIINATHAMPAGGTVTITAHNRILEDSNTESLAAGSYLSITITDQGCGIPEEFLAKIFDPYFTTKSAGNGLGLASANSIISRHNGHIGVSSVLGKGTTFTIHLPATDGIDIAHPADTTGQTVGHHDGGSILVMDDEAIIRDMATEMLEYLGYTVSTCQNGIEAVGRYAAAKKSGSPFTAVIMDLTIPGGMGGKEAAEHLLAIDREACLIVSSGYSNDPIMSDYGTYGFSGAVAKPYRISELGSLLSSLLAARHL